MIQDFIRFNQPVFNESYPPTDAIYIKASDIIVVKASGIRDNITQIHTATKEFMVACNIDTVMLLIDEWYKEYGGHSDD